MAAASFKFKVNVRRDQSGDQDLERYSLGETPK